MLTYHFSYDLNETDGEYNKRKISLYKEIKKLNPLNVEMTSKSSVRIIFKEDKNKLMETISKIVIADFYYNLSIECNAVDLKTNEKYDFPIKNMDKKLNDEFQKFYEAL